MKEKIFKISPFWTYLDLFTTGKLIIISLISLFIFEIIAILSPIIWGKYVHRPFTVSHTICREECDYQGKNITWITNERGARGELFNGQDLQMAVFGSSTSSNTLITQQLTWPEQIKYNLKSTIHVDNYAKDGAGNKEAEVVLRGLINGGRRYDAVFIMDHYGHEEREASDEVAFSDWRNVSSSWPVKSIHLIARQAEDITEDLNHKIYSILSPLKKYFQDSSFVDAPNELKHPKALSRSNRILRNEGKVELIDLPERPLNANKIQYIRDRVTVLNQLASQVSENVYFLIQPVAYDENELPGVSDRWFSLYPVSNEKPQYKSNKTVASEIREVQDIVLNTASRIGAKVINLDQELRSKLSTYDNLFLDKWHLSPIGNEMVGSMVAKRLVDDNIVKQ